MVELPELIITSSNQGISLSPRVTTEADLGSWPLAEPVLPAGFPTVYYSFPPTADNNPLKGHLPRVFVTETMPLQPAIPKARESRTSTPSIFKVKCPEEEQPGSSGALRELAEIMD